MFTKLFLVITLVAFVDKLKATDLYEQWPEEHFAQEKVTESVIEVVNNFYKQANNGSSFSFPKPCQRAYAAGWVIETEIIERNDFKLKSSVYKKEKGLKITEALKKTLSSSNQVDCTFVFNFAKFLCLEKILGSNNFDAIFSFAEQRFPSLTNISVSEGNLPIDLITDFTDYKTPITVGTLVYFSNVSVYPQKHPNGENAGENVICIDQNKNGDQLYIGFGNFFKNGPKTEQEINDFLYESFLKAMTSSENVIFSKLDDNIRQERSKKFEYYENRSNFDSDIAIENKKYGKLVFSGNKIKEMYFIYNSENPNILMLQNHLLPSNLDTNSFDKASDNVLNNTKNVSDLKSNNFIPGIRINRSIDASIRVNYKW